MKKALAIGLVIGMTLAAWGCSQRGPAETAINAAQAAFDAVKSDAQVYVPDQTKAVADQLADVRGAFDAGDYAKALTEAQAMTEKITGLKDASEAKRKELVDTWGQMSSSLPQVVESIQARVDELSKMRRLPKEISKENFEAAKTGLDELKQTWSEAVGASEGGDLIGSVSKAQTIKAKALEVMNLLGMEAPAALS